MYSLNTDPTTTLQLAAWEPHAANPNRRSRMTEEALMTGASSGTESRRTMNRLKRVCVAVVLALVSALAVVGASSAPASAYITGAGPFHDVTFSVVVTCNADWSSVNLTGNGTDGGDFFNTHTYNLQV